MNVAEGEFCLGEDFNTWFSFEENNHRKLQDNNEGGMFVYDGGGREISGKNWRKRWADITGENVMFPSNRSLETSETTFS